MHSSQNVERQHGVRTAFFVSRSHMGQAREECVAGAGLAYISAEVRALGRARCFCQATLSINIGTVR
jgi:hypothetical protein